MRRRRNENQNQMLDFIESPQSQPNVDLSLLPKGSPRSDPLVDFVLTIVKAADKRKASSIKAVRVSHLTAMCSFVVIVSGNSRPQNQAITYAIRKSIEEEYGQHVVSEGNADSGWMLLDYGSVMVHVMTPRSRLFYDIEGKWNNGEDMDLTDILIPNYKINNADSNDDGMNLSSNDTWNEEDDPFWS